MYFCHFRTSLFLWGNGLQPSLPWKKLIFIDLSSEMGTWPTSGSLQSRVGQWVRKVASWYPFSHQKGGQLNSLPLAWGLAWHALWPSDVTEVTAHHCTDGSASTGYSCPCAITGGAHLGQPAGEEEACGTEPSHPLLQPTHQVRERECPRSAEPPADPQETPGA